MNSNSRARLHRELRQMRMEAIHIATRLSRSPASRDLAQGIQTRARAIANCLEREADLAVEEVRLAAEIDALVELIAERSRTLENESAAPADLALLHARMEERSRRDGQLCIQRARLTAHLLAEHRAYLTARRLLKIRLSALA